MKSLRASFIYLVRYLLPFHKRTQIRLIFLRLFANKVDALMNKIHNFKTIVRRSINITAQTIILQYHLNDTFDPILRRILIKHYNDQGLFIGLISDGIENYVPLKLLSEIQENYNEIILALKNETNQTINADYLIYAPTSININQLIFELDKYRLAGKKYKIVNF